MVTIHILPISVLNDTCVTSTSSLAASATTAYSPLVELSVLQHIGQHNNDGNVKHVVGTDLIASSSKNVYAVLPYHRDGTLLDFCQKVGTLPEPLARFFVRQILQGLKTLQVAGLCHRNLSLDAILLDENHVDISKLGWAMQFNPTAALDANRPLPPPGGLDPHCIAPEYFSSTRGCWNGFSADLWMTGLIVFSMVIGSDALFATPVAEDKSFARICIKGDIRGQALRYGRLTGKDLSGLSDDLTHLLEKMLRADPDQRFSLQQVMEHPWLIAEEVMTATEYLNTTNAISISSHCQDS
ncbi:protein kinase domain containing protein [Nitzschia inconspicua]|uniref:Protein kinase domain containing protein n=1 Tax=Nitzschia inconspicua TaxID=303405 RepID=A0A9K3KWS1_9STRA|nr:protein kinase domain containing protein [Nitzschia inconspicua]